MAVLFMLAFMPAVAQAKTTEAAEPAPSRSADAVQAIAPGDATVWYLAEGYTGGDFDTWVLVQNPGTKSTKVTLDFQLPPGASAPAFQFDLPAASRRSIHLDTLPGLAATDVSTRVTSVQPVVAERSMYFDYNGKTGGHDSIGVKYPSAVWYLAEGYTGGDFDTYVLVQNPGTALTTVTLDFQLPPGSSAPSYQFPLPGHTRKTVHLDELPGLAATDVSTKVSSPIPVVAERAMYFNYYGKDGGHDSVGVENPSQSWYLAEGFTGGEFDTYVLVQNPGKDPAKVTLDFQLPPGASAPSYKFDLPAGTRKTVHLDELPALGATDVSTKVTSDKAVVAERAMYFNYYGKTDGHDSAGVTTPNSDWYLAEGYTGGDFDTYVLVQNPGKKDKKVTLHFQLPPGSHADSYSFNLQAGTRRTVHLDELPGLKSTDVSTWVDASGPVVVERAMYFNYEGKDGGSCSTGAVYEPPIIPATTNILTDGDMKHLVSAVDTANNRRVFKFDTATPNLRKVGVGDIIISASTYYPMPPFKVTAVGHDGGYLVLTARGAALEETIWRGRVSLASMAAKGAGGADYPGGASLVHMDKTFNVNQRVGTGSNYVDLTGSAHVIFDLDFSVDVDFTLPSVDYTWHKTRWGISYLTLDVNPPSVSLKSMSFGASFTEQIAIDATVHGDFSINNWATTVPGTKIDLPQIEFAIGPVPVWLDPYIQLAVGVDGSVHTQISAGVTQSATVSAGESYTDSGGWSPNNSNSFSYTLRPPSATGSFDCKFSLGPQVGILLYSTAGPYVNVLPGFRMTGNSNNAHPGNPLWGMYVDLDLFVGIKVQVEVGVLKWSWTMSIVDKYWHVLNWEMLLAESVRLYALSPTSGGTGSNVTLSGTGFGSSRENGSYVSFGDARAGEYASWAEDSIVCKVPPGVSGVVNVKVTHIFHDWVVGPIHVTIQETSNAKQFNVTTPSGNELLSNGDFSGGLANWSIINQGGSNVHGTNSLTLKTEGDRKVVYMYRRCPENDGGSSGVAQALNASTAGAGALYLTARVKCGYQRGGAIAGSDPRWYPEGPVQFRILFRRPDGSTGEWYHGFYYGSVAGADTAHFTKVSQNSWDSYSSGNILPEIGAGSVITEFRAYGFGWDFDGYASNLSLQKN
jgi:hypothetical protein